jgi:hypothetical protein
MLWTSTPDVVVVATTRDVVSNFLDVVVDNMQRVRGYGHALFTEEPAREC